MFDLDGTLTDPEPGITRCIRFALEQLELPVPHQTQLQSWIGPPLRASFSDWFKQNQLKDNADQADQALALYRQRFAQTGLFENTPYLGIRTLLENLNQQGKQLFVATAKPTIYASRIIQHFKLDEFFTEIHGSELDGSNSNKADLLRKIIAQHKLKTEDCLMIGDRHYDINAAKHHQISNIGILWGYGSVAELNHAGADNIVNTVKQLATKLL